MKTIHKTQTYAPVPLASYPHMLDADAALWDRYLKTNPFPHAKVMYDVRVGTPAAAPDHYPDNYRRMVLELSTLRIDAVVLIPTETLIIEVKPRASLTAIGQAHGYAQLLHRDMPNLPNPVPVILTDTAAPDTQWLCDRLQILLIQLD